MSIGTVTVTHAATLSCKQAGTQLSSVSAVNKSAVKSHTVKFLAAKCLRSNVGSRMLCSR